MIRPECPADAAAIRAVVKAAFGQPWEADLVEALRQSGDAVISLVAEEDSKIVGHVMLSTMDAPFRALGLAPVSVAPAAQGSGIGGALIGEGLRLARLRGTQMVFVLGDPTYYGRFGFSARAAKGFDSPFAGPDLQALVLDPAIEPIRSGRIAYAPAFAATT